MAEQSPAAPASILGFWRDLEVFNIPTAPTPKDNTKQVKIVTVRPGETLPWKRREFTPTDEYGFIHVVYLGTADMEDMSRLLLQSVFPDQDLSERERQRASGRGWLAAFVVNEYGCAKLDSYLAASFAHGAMALRETNSVANVNARLQRATGEFTERRHKLELAPGEAPPTIAASSLSWQDLDEELAVVRKLLGPHADDPSIDWRLVVRVSRVKRRYVDDNLQAATEFLNSFYLDDLDRLIAQTGGNQPFGKALASYLGPEVPKPLRVDVLADHVAMTQLVSAKHLPSARWPTSSAEPLVLAQQATVAHVLRTLRGHPGVVGVNGPPGTGKTTLLRDVIAEVIVERARRIAALAKPGEIFEPEATSVDGKKFTPIKTDIMAGTAIVVASNNNNAVKNITQELPARARISPEFGEPTYFDEVIREVFAAQHVVDEDKQPIETWGLIAAALGNVGNRRAFAKGFYRGETKKAAEDIDDIAPESESVDNVEAIGQEQGQAEPPSIKQVLDQADAEYARYISEWRTAKQRFTDLLAQFDTVRSTLIAAEQAAAKIGEHQRQLTVHEAALAEKAAHVATIVNRLAQSQQARQDQRTLVESRTASLASIRQQHAPSLIERMLAWIGVRTTSLEEKHQRIASATQSLAEASEALATMSRDILVAEQQLREQERQLGEQRRQTDALKAEIRRHQLVLDKGYATGAKHFPDGQFWQMPNGDRHRASIAVGPAIDKLRALIFLEAVELHRLTILTNTGKFAGNLRAVNGMLTGSSRDRVPLSQRPMLWDIFFFVVPVVSTTLASFDRLFAGMEQESLGWLLIDEAGQATPQSAAGALWRSQRAVLIGDPLQIEPVFTVPLGLVEEFRRRRDVSDDWSPKLKSVQMLADRITPYGSWVAQSGKPEMEEDPIWTGLPLRTHRRCDDPMFSVSNQIAYAGQMVHGRVDQNDQPIPVEFECVLGNSAWFDVVSDECNHPVVDAEIDALVDCIRQLTAQPPTLKSGKRGKIFVISPFRRIKDACKARLRDEGLDSVECGTVHTFQGKEAEIVFLVLGTAPGEAGSGARGWAAGSPNLLNVAITRAKCRLYVLGNAEQWRCYDYFRDLCNTLPTVRVAEDTLSGSTIGPKVG